MKSQALEVVSRAFEILNILKRIKCPKYVTVGTNFAQRQFWWCTCLRDHSKRETNHFKILEKSVLVFILEPTLWHDLVMWILFTNLKVYFFNFSRSFLNFYTQERGSLGANISSIQKPRHTIWLSAKRTTCSRGILPNDIWLETGRGFWNRKGVSITILQSRQVLQKTVCIFE